jgi:hypothetical protein
MPVHDWTRVTAGTFHDFHLAWIAELRRALNAGLLPEGYYALAEQVAGEVAPDVLTLQDLGGTGASAGAQTPAPHDRLRRGNGQGGIAVAEHPPRVSETDTVTEAMLLAARRRLLVIRHTTGDRIVALLEIVSPGNKQNRAGVQSFVDKAVAALNDGYHLLVLDLLPPGPFDPQGMHGAIWSRLGGAFRPPEGKPLTLASYVARSGGALTCYVEPISVTAALPEMPLFLDPDHYVNVPLEPTYGSAYEGVPGRWKRVIEASP